MLGFGLHKVTSKSNRMVLGKASQRVKAPYMKFEGSAAGSRVLRDTWNLEGAGTTP